MKLRTVDKVCIIDDKIVKEYKPMKKMYIEDAVNYCLNHKAVIYTSTKDIYNSLMSYLDDNGYKWYCGGTPSSHPQNYDEYKDCTCICLNESPYLMYCYLSYYKDRYYEIIGLNTKSVSIDNTIYYNKDKAISKIESIFSSFPSAGDIYYFIDSFGSINYTTWNNRPRDNSRLAVGNCYKTEEETESALDRVIKAYRG